MIVTSGCDVVKIHFGILVSYVFTLGLQNVVRSSKYPINHVITSQRWKPYLSLLIICLIYIIIIFVIISLLNYFMTLVMRYRPISNFI